MEAGALQRDADAACLTVCFLFSAGPYETNLLLPRTCLFGLEDRKGFFFFFFFLFRVT